MRVAEAKRTVNHRALSVYFAMPGIILRENSRGDLTLNSDTQFY